MAKLVSKTYGDALFEVALEKNQLDEFLDEVKAAQTAIEENKELFKLMSHPKIVKEEKIKRIYIKLSKRGRNRRFLCDNRIYINRNGIRANKAT